MTPFSLQVARVSLFCDPTSIYIVIQDTDEQKHEEADDENEDEVVPNNPIASGKTYNPYEAAFANILRSLTWHHLKLNIASVQNQPLYIIYPKSHSIKAHSTLSKFVICVATNTSILDFKHKVLQNAHDCI